LKCLTRTITSLIDLTREANINSKGQIKPPEVIKKYQHSDFSLNPQSAN